MACTIDHRPRFLAFYLLSSLSAIVGAARGYARPPIRRGAFDSGDSPEFHIVSYESSFPTASTVSMSSMSER